MAHKIKCFKCGGKGKIVNIDPFLGVVTFGITALIEWGDPDRCDACDGRGWLYQDEDEDDE